MNVPVTVSFPRILTVAQTMDILNVSKPTIYRLIDRGLLKRIKIMDATRITAESIEKLLASDG